MIPSVITTLYNFTLDSYGRETKSLGLREEHRLRVFEDEKQTDCMHLKRGSYSRTRENNNDDLQSCILNLTLLGLLNEKD
jgi:hypothetical protein